MKRVVTFALLLVLCVSLAGCGGTAEGGPVPLSAVPDPSDEEVRQAVDLGLLIAPVPDGPIPFDDCKALLDNLVELCDPAALPAWNDSVSAEKFPRRDMRREDGLILLFLAAEAWRREILDSPGELECTGTAYYVSNAGSDRNSGRSPQEAWSTLDRVNEANLRPGDGVYFQRGRL